VENSMIRVSFLTVFILSAALGTVSAHDGREGSASADHMTHYELRLEPGEQESFRVTWADQVLKARWLFLLSATVTGDADVRVNLRAPNAETPFVTWDWDADADVHTQIVELPEDGFYDLTFFSSAQSSESAHISYQFDQSCECTGKNLDLEGGVILFQQQAEVGERIQFSIDRFEGRDFFVWAGVRNENVLSWKDGFDSVAIGSNTRNEVVIDYVADRPGLQYFFIESISGVGFVVPEYTPLGTYYTTRRGQPSRLLGIAISLLSLIVVPLLVYAIIRAGVRAGGDSGARK